MKTFLIFNTSDRLVLSVKDTDIDSVPSNSEFKTAVSKQKGRILTIIEVAQTKSYTRPMAVPK